MTILMIGDLLKMTPEQEKAIAYNNEFRNYCKENALPEDAPLTKDNIIKAIDVILRIYNYKIRFHKPLKNTILKCVPLKFIDKFAKIDAISSWNNDLFVDKTKLLEFREYLTTIC